MKGDSADLMERSRKIVPGGVHSPVRSFSGLKEDPIFFERAQGAHLYSVEGDKYIDYCQSFGPMLLGHRDPEVYEEVKNILDKAWSFGACEPYSLALAEWMTQEIPWLDSVRFVNSGTEAVMSALRVAKGYTGRNKILKFDGCYHGHVDSMLVKAGSGLAGVGTGTSAGISEAIASETIVAPLDREDIVKELFTEHGSDIAAVIIEPLPANYGLLVQRDEFIQSVVKTAREHGALVIFDEVISGFRVALGGMAELLGIEPDLVTYGKIIGGGFPVGCFGGKKEIMNSVAPVGDVYQAGTLSANPVCMVAGLANLKKIKRDNVILKCNQKTAYLAKSINDIFSSNNMPLECYQYASLFWITERRDKKIRQTSEHSSKQAHNFGALFSGLLKHGVYIAPNAFEVGFMSIAHTDEILEETIEKIKLSIQGLSESNQNS